LFRARKPEETPEAQRLPALKRFSAIVTRLSYLCGSLTVIGYSVTFASAELHFAY
jgi:hypothetical protein